MKKFSFFIISSLILINTNAQQIQWTKCLGGSASDFAYSIQQTTDGGYIAAGSTGSNDGDVWGHHGGSDSWIIKLNASGDTLFTRSLGGNSSDKANSIQQTSDGGYIIAGYTSSSDGDVWGSNGEIDSWIIKLNANLDTLWTKCLGGSSYEMAHSIQQTTDDGYITAGYTISNDGDVCGNHGYEDFWIVKLDAIGDTLWTKCLGGSDPEIARSIQQTIDGGYIAIGFTRSSDGDIWGNHGDNDTWIVKLNASGDTLWTKCLGGGNIDYANSIQQTTDGGYIAAGHTKSSNGDVLGNNGAFDAWIVKLNVSGDILWTKCLGGSDWDLAYSIQQTSDGGYIVAGETRSYDGDIWGNHGNYDSWIVKLNASGDTLWTKCLGGSDMDRFQSIQQTSDGGYIAAGYTSSSGGDVLGNHGAQDFWIVKLDASGDMVEEYNNKLNISIYPNPTTSLITIDAEGIYNIEVLNIEGKEIYNGKENEIDLSQEPNGIYIIKVITDKQTITRKLIKQ